VRQCVCMCLRFTFFDEDVRGHQSFRALLVQEIQILLVVPALVPVEHVLIVVKVNA
jgi:hypothetical protein